jgi:predicted nucleic acid-binding Zn ribbon protein
VTNRWKCVDRGDGMLFVGNVMIERDGTDYSGKSRITDRSSDALGDHRYGQWNAGHLWGALRLLRCVQCDGLFVGHHAATLCSDECQRSRLAAKRRFRPSRISRTVRRRQARQALTCVVCGAPLDAERSNRKCCSDRCRQRRHRIGLLTIGEEEFDVAMPVEITVEL